MLCGQTGWADAADSIGASSPIAKDPITRAQPENNDRQNQSGIVQYEGGRIAHGDGGHLALGGVLEVRS